MHIHVPSDQLLSPANPFLYLAKHATHIFGNICKIFLNVCISLDDLVLYETASTSCQIFHLLSEFINTLFICEKLLIEGSNLLDLDG